MLPGDPAIWTQVGRYLDAYDYEVLWGVPEGWKKVEEPTQEDERDEDL